MTQRWTPPPVGIMKINTDDAFHEKTHSGGWFTLRNDIGAVAAAEAGNLEHVSDTLHTEALAMLHAVNVAIRIGCDRLILETDSLLLKQALTSNIYDLSHLGAIFRDIKCQHRVGLSHVSVKHCSRECNHVAYTLAAHGTTM
uniref:RNase H type-1 domain-containing protein n=1 Tax=Triticum urartu TaxID=4572 RepID=A0A8R7RCL6_TRIUA